MKIIKIVTKLSLLGVILVSGCIGGSKLINNLEGSEWNLVKIKGVAALTDSGVTLGFTDGQTSGNAGCNSYSGGYTVGSKGSIEFGMMASTRMACPDPEGLMEQENAYQQALEETVTFNIAGDELTLEDESGSVLLVFERATAE